MSITSLRIENFKGVFTPYNIKIKPLTLLIGPNSSGKSSAIHALTALAQTAKLPSSGRALVLDDEYAQIHLGRFIEVIHTRSYKDSIRLGVTFKGVVNRFLTQKSNGEAHLAADYTFKSTRRTQDVYLQNLKYETNDNVLTMSLNSKKTHFVVDQNSAGLDYQSVYDASLAPTLNFVTVPEANTTSHFNLFVFNEECKRLIRKEFSQVFYLGPFRQSPLRRYPTRGSNPVEVGPQGENTITLLANDYVQTKSRVHVKRVGAWLEEMNLARSVGLTRLGTSDMFDVRVTLPDGAGLPVADLGYGMSQVLPVLTQCSCAPKNATLLFEQPELHLHLSAAKRLARVFVDAMQKNGLTIVAETHSKELFYGLISEIKAGRLSIDDIAAYTVARQNGESIVTPVILEKDSRGNVEPVDPWDQSL